MNSASTAISWGSKALVYAVVTCAVISNLPNRGTSCWIGVALTSASSVTRRAGGGGGAGLRTAAPDEGEAQRLSGGGLEDELDTLQGAGHIQPVVELPLRPRALEVIGTKDENKILVEPGGIVREGLS